MKRVALAILAAAILPAAALAESTSEFPGTIPDNLRFRFGGIYANVASDVILSTPSFPGTDVNLNDIFGQPHKFTFRGEGFWNFAGRSFLDFGYIGFGTKRSATLTQDIDFGGVIYHAGASVENDSFTQFFYAAYRYGFIKNPKFQLGMSLGVGYLTLRETLDATGHVTQPDGTTITGSVSKEAQIRAPVPLLGIEAEGQITETVSLGARFRAFGATVSPYSGNVEEALAHVDWFISKNVGVGGGFEWARFDVKKTQDSKTIQITYRYDGPRIYVIVTF